MHVKWVVLEWFTVVTHPRGWLVYGGRDDAEHGIPP
jgi:hypothetical protein